MELFVDDDPENGCRQEWNGGLRDGGERGGRPSPGEFRHRALDREQEGGGRGEQQVGRAGAPRGGGGGVQVARGAAGLRVEVRRREQDVGEGETVVRPELRGAKPGEQGEMLVGHAGGGRRGNRLVQ